MRRRKNIFLVFNKEESNPDDIQEFNKQYFGSKKDEKSDDPTFITDLTFEMDTDTNSGTMASKSKTSSAGFLGASFGRRRGSDEVTTSTVQKFIPLEDSTSN